IFLSGDDGRIFQVKNDVPPPVSPVFLKSHYAAGQRGILKAIPTVHGTFVGAFEAVPGTNMTVLTLQLKREAFWDISLTVWLTLFFLLALLTASYFAALFLAGRISGPVELLKNAADRIMRHDFKRPVDLRPMWGDFAGLAATFNLMQSELGRYHSLQLDKLFDEKRKLDLLISLMRDGVMLTDAQYRVLFLNDSAKRVLDSGLFDALFQGRPALSRREKNRLIAREVVAKYAGREAFLVPRSGGKSFFRAMSELFKANSSGEAVRLIVLRDVTIEHEIDVMKEDFFNAIAHDLRAPLLGMQGYIKLIEASARDARERDEYLAAMAVSVRRLFELVEGVLEIARMETGSIKLNPSEFSFEECAGRAVDALRPVLEDKRLAVTVAADPAADTVYGDERLVGRVLNNLLSNAAKFTPPGGSVTIDCHATEAGGRLVRVSDTGIGVDPENLETIFEKYRQTEAGKTAGGYGLGLAIVRTIAAVHGGSARAKSAGAGKGTVFELTLPPKPGPDAPQTAVTHSAAVAPAAVRRRRRRPRHRRERPI
ncbi:MAG: HAMP domain-containing sensor histidine kinase, partial [Elusimicrobiaceae bacterium]|nr:HAMP domain-containing sensor histidine kinase [Elusimicrobiaceae bacterium]